MIKKKYEILYDQHKEVYGVGTVYRIYALTSFGSVAAGTLGGWVQDYNNLSQEGSCWVDDNAIVCGNARVKDNAQVLQNTRILDNAVIFDEAVVKCNAVISGAASVGGTSLISDAALIADRAQVRGDSLVLDLSSLNDSSMIVDCVIKNRTQLVGQTYFRDQKILETPIQVQIRDYWCYKNPKELYTIGCYSFPKDDLEKMLKNKKTFMEWNYFKPDDYEMVLPAFDLLSGKVQEAVTALEKKSTTLH